MEKSLRAKILWMANHHLRDVMTKDSSIVRNQTTSADNELTVGSGEESDSEDSSEHDSDDLTARSSFAGKNGRVRFTTCPPPSKTHARNL